MAWSRLRRPSAAHTRRPRPQRLRWSRGLGHLKRGAPGGKLHRWSHPWPGHSGWPPRRRGALPPCGTQGGILMASPTPSHDGAGSRKSFEHAVAMRCVTLIMATVIGLTFLFGFGNVLALGLRLGVPAYVAPLVAPAVDLSVLGLLLGVRHLALNDAPREQIRPARRLLVLASMMTLALNVTEPLPAGAFGRAAFDAVGPMLLIGWAEVGPGLLQAISSTGSAAEIPAESATDQRPKVSTAPARQSRPKNQRSYQGSKDLLRADSELLQRARLEDARHQEEWQRPISAETLRKRLGVGAKKSRTLVDAVRSEQSHLPAPGRTDADAGGPSDSPRRG